MRKIICQPDKIDTRGIRHRRLEHLFVKDLLSESFISDVVLNNILGAVAFYELYEGQLQILRVNDQYCRLVGMSLTDMDERHSRLLDYVHPSERDMVMRDGFQKAYEDTENEGASIVVRRRMEDGSYKWIQMRIFYLKERNGRLLYYIAASDANVIRVQK